MKISIITVNYNNSDGLKQTIESVCSQSYKEIEYIIIDGGSTDNSVPTIKLHKQDIYYWISEKDNGIYEAMNKGLSHATGDYCLFLNSGDVFVNKNVLKRIFSDREYKDDLIVGRQLTIFPIGRQSKNREIRLEDINKEFFYSNTLPHQCTFIKRQLLEEMGGYRTDYRIVSDWIFWFEAIVHRKASIKIIDTLVATMQQGGISNDINKCHKEMARYLSSQKSEFNAEDWQKTIVAYQQSYSYQCATRTTLSRLLVKIALFLNK